MKVYSVRNTSNNAVKYFDSIEKVIAHISYNGRHELAGEIAEITEDRIGTEYEYKVIVKAHVPEADSIFACFGTPEDDVYMISGHDVL